MAPRVSVAFGPEARLRYTEQSPIEVTGPATGRTYRFAADEPVRGVDVRDVDALLRTRLFIGVDG